MKNKFRSKYGAKWLCVNCGLYNCKEDEGICSTCKQVREEVGCRIGTLKSNKPKITFDKSATNFILKAFNISINTVGYLVLKNHEIAVCSVCGSPIHIKKFAGVINEMGLICNNIVCLTTITNRIS